MSCVVEEFNMFLVKPTTSLKTCNCGLSVPLDSGIDLFESLVDGVGGGSAAVDEGASREMECASKTRLTMREVLPLKLFAVT
ncbi:hypothetical protein L1987_58966 [Smallanthus sonchifolius]|uniref:Uncharacterized protein n=1 Tax=Smallanthus sonchifolius TaxID=185202 RepID=A0ACB9D3W6_9ASTR|nr:hypothetical protein L1987_58966 [Smallanthus sonchifolius]